MGQVFQGFEQVHENLWWWEVFDEKMKAPLSASAIRTLEGMLLFDPVDLPREHLAELCRKSSPCAIFLTNHNHERSAARLQRDLKVPVYAPAMGVYEKLSPDVLFQPGQRLPGGIAAVAVPGATENETAYLDQRGGGTLVQGDTFINMSEGGPAFLPAKYADDFGKMKRSAEDLLRLSFETVTTAHGKPFEKAKAALKKLFKK